MPTRDEVADVLDKAHDELLVRGRSYRFEDDAGRVCVMHATGLGAMAVADSDTVGFAQRSKELANAADDALRAVVGCERLVTWNFMADDDEVLEGCRLASKALRNGELEVA